MLEEQEAVLEAVNVVDHDIDECVQTLEKIYQQKLERLTKFGGIFMHIDTTVQVLWVLPFKHYDSSMWSCSNDSSPYMLTPSALAVVLHVHTVSMVHA